MIKTCGNCNNCIQDIKEDLTIFYDCKEGLEVFLDYMGYPAEQTDCDKHNN